MVVLLATSGIVSQTPVAFVFAEDGDSAEEVTEAETAAASGGGSDGGGDDGGGSDGGGDKRRRK